MKETLKYIVALLMLLVALPGFSTGVKDLRNVHLDDARRYVTDPTGVMTSAQVAQADAIIGRIWQQTSAEVLAVVIDRADYDDANTLATQIFTDWGIGKKDNDNGVLLLIDNENHEVVIRTGYGTEGVLPDIISGRIIRNTIIPTIREQGVGAGVVAGLQQIEEVLTNPEYASELRSKYANDSSADFGDDSMTTGEIVFIAIFLLGVMAFGIYMSKKAQAPKKCPKCHTQLEPTNPSAIMTYLNPAQQTEQRIGSKSYTALRCPQDGTVVLTAAAGPAASQYTDCPKCGARALKVMRVDKDGRGNEIITERCENCGNINTRRRNNEANKALLAILAAQALRGMMRGGGGGGSFGGGFGGGSMGGGSTGGGGASGRW